MTVKEYIATQQPVILFEITELSPKRKEVPSCGNDGQHGRNLCDIEENPAHWVGINLSTELRDLIDRMASYCPVAVQDEARAYLIADKEAQS